MIDNLNQTITNLNTFPDRPNYTTSNAYAQAVADWLSEEGIFSGEIGNLVPKLEAMINQINTDIQGVNNAVLVTGFMGEYDNGTTYDSGDSVYYDGAIYVSIIDSNSDLPTTSNWKKISDSGYSKNEVDNLLNDKADATHNHDGIYLKPDGDGSQLTGISSGGNYFDLKAKFKGL